ncbi:MAG: ArsA family ATPase, partial [Pseudonocardiaceae bacterium]
ARAETVAEALERGGKAPLAAAVLRLHADRVAIAGRERRLLARFSKAHPAVPVIGIPTLARDVYDLPGLREIGLRLAGA